MPPDPSRRVMLFYSLRLADLITPKATLVVTCGACRRSSSLDVVSLARSRGPITGIKGIERGLRCAGCCHKEWASIDAIGIPGFHGDPDVLCQRQAALGLNVGSAVCHGDRVVPVPAGVDSGKQLHVRTTRIRGRPRVQPGGVDPDVLVLLADEIAGKLPLKWLLAEIAKGQLRACLCNSR